MTDLAAIDSAARQSSLEVLGAFHPTAQDNAPDGTATLVLLGPAEPGFWKTITTSTEYRDGEADPIDRWSERVVGDLATGFEAMALFPFGDPPYLPFIAWAQRTGRIWASPVTLLVHETQGLMLSIRGGLALREKLDLPAPSDRPCDTCADQPCRTACPVNALGSGGYHTADCHTYLETPEGRRCMDGGCRVRRACPISQNYGRVEAQSAYHMRRFHR